MFRVFCYKTDACLLNIVGQTLITRSESLITSYQIMIRLKHVLSQASCVYIRGLLNAGNIIAADWLCLVLGTNTDNKIRNTFVVTRLKHVFLACLHMWLQATL